MTSQTQSGASTPVVLKLSGEVFGSNGFNDGSIKKYLVPEITSVVRADETRRIVVVIGGGNILRGKQAKHFMNQTDADYAGMSASMTNGIVLRSVLSRAGLRVAHMCTLEQVNIPGQVQPWSYGGAKDFFLRPGILVVSGGTGKPGVSTDSGTVQIAEMLGAKMIIKGTKVGGLFTADPKKDTSATFIKQITPTDFVSRRFSQIFDAEAVKRAGELGIEIRILDFFTPGNLRMAFAGDDVGSLIAS